METIFAKNALTLLHRGYSVIPIAKNSKIPVSFMKGWQKYSLNLPTEEEIAAWSRSAAACNIAIVCGKASRIVCLDIDDDRLLTSPFLQSSPLIRKGKKGEARFFQWEDWMTNFSIPGKIDFIANDRYVLIPPSIHPETLEPYEWTGHFKTMVSYEETPRLDRDLFEQFRIECSKLKIESNAGRNEKLKSMVVAAFHNYKSKEEIISEVLDYDLQNHFPPLFTDSTEPYFRKMKSEKLAATLFVGNILKSLQPANVSNEPTHTIQILSKVDSVKQEIKIPIPKTDLLKRLQSTALSYGDSYNESIALCASLACMSMLLANRFVLDTKWHRTPANLFLMTIAPSGTGKNIVKKVISNLFHGQSFMSGYHNTSASFLDHLSQHREMLMLVEEMSAALKLMKNTKDMHATSMCENLCDVFTSNDNVFLPSMSITAKNNKRSESIMNPYVSLVGTTTGKGLEDSTNSYLVEKGLLPRFLFFTQSWSPLFDLDNKPEDHSHYIRDFFSDFYKSFPIDTENTSLVSKKVNHRVLLLTPSAQKLFNDMYIKENTLKRMREIDSSELNAFLVRKLELVSRIALIDAVSSGNLTTVNEDNLNYAESVFEFSIHCIKEYIPIIFGSDYGRTRQHVLNYIKRKGMCTKSEISNNFRNLPISEKQKILFDLEQAGSIIQYNDKSNGRERMVYKFVEDII